MIRIPVRPRGNRRQRRPPTRLSVERLERRDLLAILTVGADGQFATWQAAIDHARGNDEVLLSAGTYAESVDLSRMGSAVGGQPGHLTVRGAGDQTVISPSSGPALFNASTWQGDLRLHQLVFAGGGPDSAPAIQLVDFRGAFRLTNSRLSSWNGSGVVLRDMQGALVIEDSVFDQVGNGPGEHAIDIEEYHGNAILRRNTIVQTADSGIVFTNSRDQQASLLVSDTVLGGDPTFLATTRVGLAVDLTGTSRSNLVLDSLTVEAIADTALILRVGGQAEVDARWSRSVLSNIHGPLAVDVHLAGQSRTVFTATENLVLDCQRDGLEFSVGDQASARLLLRQNEFLSVGLSQEDDALTVLSDALSSGDIRLSLDRNRFTTVAGNGARLSASGTSSWYAHVVDNEFAENNTSGGLAAFLAEQPSTSDATAMRLALRDNTVADSLQGAYLLAARGNGAFQLEGTAQTPESQLADTNDGGPVAVSGTVTLVPDGAFLAAVPLVVGDRVWIDSNGDGVQGDEESGWGQVAVSLQGTETATQASVSRTAYSDDNGVYWFGGLAAGDYFVSLSVPAGFRLTSPRQGLDRQRDSNFDAATASTQVLLADGLDDLSVDAGLLTTWQNPRLRVDVNADGIAAPGDALIVINELNRGGSRQLVLPAFGTAAPPPYYDTNGDGFLAPLDVLVIVNYLNRQSGGEGESTAPGAEVADGIDGSMPSWLWYEYEWELNRGRVAPRRAGGVR